ncbi:MAG: threonylcarbamoyl-AMP synthase [Candidatus Melainabacteria bacterium]|nr:threonylcarbamoyl-AMP synthase [Candidatus Melainabacteria bacterium]
MPVSFKRSLSLLLKNEPIILPTDTVYGLVCRYDSKSAVEKIYKLKKRTRKKPLILLGYNWKALKIFVSVETLHATSQLQKLVQQWPGPLTIILPASKHVPKFLNNDFKTVGVRVPKNKFLLKLLKQCPAQVLASTSANLSGKSDLRPQKELLKKIKLFIKAEKGEMSLKPSKIIEIRNNKIVRLRR